MFRKRCCTDVTSQAGSWRCFVTDSIVKFTLNCIKADSVYSKITRCIEIPPPPPHSIQWQRLKAHFEPAMNNVDFSIYFVKYKHVPQFKGPSRQTKATHWERFREKVVLTMRYMIEQITNVMSLSQSAWISLKPPDNISVQCNQVIHIRNKLTQHLLSFYGN